MTKQDRELAYLMKAVREYNEIVGHGDVGRLQIMYDGIALIITSLNEVGTEQPEHCIDFTKVKYTRGCNMIRAITDKIKKEGARL